MDWWQLALVLLLIAVNLVVVGLFLGIFLRDFVRRREAASFEKYHPSPRVNVKLKATVPDSLAELPEKRKTTERQAKAHGTRKTAERKSKEAEIILEQVKPTGLNPLLAELEKNRELSIEPKPEKLIPFQTQVWGTSRNEIHTLPANLRWELTQAYLDMFLANNIIWFLSEFNRKSPDLDDQYMKICAQITSRLDRIIPLLK